MFESIKFFVSKQYYKTIILVMLLLASTAISAVELSDITLQSALYKPFNATITLSDIKDINLATMKIGVASRDEFKKRHIDYPNFLDDLLFHISTNATGKSIVTITSVKPMNQPYISFLVQATWPQGMIIKKYTVLLDPSAAQNSKKSPDTIVNQQQTLTTNSENVMSDSAAAQANKSLQLQLQQLEQQNKEIETKAAKVERQLDALKNSEVSMPVATAPVVATSQNIMPDNLAQYLIPILIVFFLGLIIRWQVKRKSMLAKQIQATPISDKSSSNIVTGNKIPPSFGSKDAPIEKPQDKPQPTGSNSESKTAAVKKTSTPTDIDAEYSESVAENATATKLDLAQAYIEMGDYVAAKRMLQAVIAQGDVHDSQIATALLEQIEKF